MLLEKFQSDGALPGNDGIVIKGVNEGEMVGRAAAQRFVESFVVICAVQDDVGTVSAGGRNFDERRGQGHTDLSAYTEFTGVIGEALSVISG